MPNHEHSLADDPLLGRQLANFRIDRPLGRGGMAQVYYGWDVRLQRPAAIKVIDARFRDNPAYAARFVREAQTIAKWRHENIIHIYYAGDEKGLYYFAMEYIDGQDLGQLLAQSAAKGQLLPPTEVLRIGRAAANALDYAHQQGIIHRDVKPSNIMIAQDGRVVLTDFGLAMDVQQGSTGEIFGSAHYIAPEQARDSAAAVPQSDLYALGVILYEMLTGAVPFDDPSPTAVAVQHMTALPPPPRDLNPALNSKTEVVLLKALSKSPRLRFQTGSELVETLARALQSDPAAIAPASPPALPEAALYTKTEIAKPTLPPSAPPPSAPWLDPRPAPLPVAAAPAESKDRNNFLLVVIGLGLALLLICAAASAILFFRPGISGQNAAAGAETPTALILFTATVPPTSAPPTVTPSPTTSSPTETPTATATQPAVALLTLTPTPTPSPTDTLTPTPVPTETPVSTDTPTATPIPTDTPTPEAPTPPPVLSYNLLLAGLGGDSLFVVNQSAEPFPLAPLRLGDDAGTVSGTEWKVELLDSGACVAIWKEGNAKPAGAACTEVGEHLTRPRKERFWDKAFNVYYNENLIGPCDNDPCSLSIPK